MSKINKYFWFLFPAILIFALILGPILRDGMFLDGLVYTNIAQNLAEGNGSLWSPLVFRHGDVFYEHPVLLPYLESFFFRAFGDGLHVEDLYNTTILILTIAALYGIWRDTVEHVQRQYFFFPLLLWVLNQEVQLRYPNTMLECGTTLILLATTFCYLKVERKSLFFSASLVGLGVFLAVLAKGPFGLFLLVLPLLHQWFQRRQFSIFAALIPVFMTIICFGILFLLQPEALTFFQQYFDQQVLAAIAGERTENIANTRFDFVYWLVVLNLPGLIICSLLLLVKTSNPLPFKAKGWLFVVLGAAAIVPLVLSIKQAAYYQLVALPFFVLGLSLLLLPRIRQVVEWIDQRTRWRTMLMFVGLTGLTIGLGLAVSMQGTTDLRDREVIALTNEVAEVFRKEGAKDYRLEFLGNQAEAASRSYRLTNFLNRYHNIHLDRSGTAPLTVYLRAGTSEKPPGDIIFHQSGISIGR